MLVTSSTNDTPINTSSKTQLQSQSEIFVKLFEADRERLYAYIYAYMMNRAAADDIFQETSMTLWHEFDRFELGTNFSKWANGIAFNRVRVYRRTNKKFTLGLSEELILSMLENVEEDTDIVDTKSWDHLQECRSLLSNQEHHLYDAFYIKNLKAQTIAEQTDRSIFAIRKSIHKLRKKLFDCVDKKTHKEAV